MNLLLLSPVAVQPPRYGASTRIHFTARELARRHAVTVVSFEDDNDRADRGVRAPFDLVPLPWTPVRRTRFERWLSRFGLWNRTPASAANVEAIRALLDSRDIDAVLVENLHLAEMLPVVAGRPIVWVEHGIYSELRRPSLRRARNAYRSLQDWLTWRLWRRLEHWCWSHADVIVAVSEPEASEIRRRLRNCRPVVVVPNGVDAAYFATTERRPEPGRALFVGSRWYANVEGLHFFARDVLPLVLREVPDFRLSVVGDVANSRELRLPVDDRLELVGFVNELRPHYGAASALVAPLLRGHGTRLKILEAMAAGVPVVSTRKGAEGLDVRDGVDLLLADRPEEIASALVRVLTDPALATRLSESARQRVTERYDWTKVCDGYEAALALLPGRSEPNKAAEPPTHQGASFR